MWVGGNEPSSGGSRLQTRLCRTQILMDRTPLGVELQLQHLLLHTSGIWSEQSNTRWFLRFKARGGNWISTFHTSRPDSCWLHLGKLPWASAKVRVQHAGKLPSSISWKREQPTAGADMPGEPLWLHTAPAMEHRPGLIRSFQAPQERACTALLHNLRWAREIRGELMAPCPDVRSPVRPLRLQHFQRYS